MPVFNPKNRMISFRLSEEQFALLQEASIRTGARSVSEYARDAIVRLLHHRHEGANGDGVTGRINKLACDLESLDAEIQHLREIVLTPSEVSR
jgi:hypothetical protein